MEENTQYKRYERLENTNLDSGWIRELAEALNEKQELEKRIGYLETLTKYLYVLTGQLYLLRNGKYVVIRDLSGDELKKIVQDIVNNGNKPQEELVLEMEKRGFPMPEPDIEAF